MKIEIHDEKLESRLLKQLEKTGSATLEELLVRLVETQEEQDRWLSDNQQWVNAKIRRGIDQLNRGEGISEDHLDAHLAKLKSTLE
jgi:ribosome assembly protein YihI (activator of Der GTPase)